VRLDLPFKLDHVHVWLLDDGDTWTVVDAGIGNDATWTAWQQLTRSVLGDKPIGRIVLTHFHPDHVGAAPWLADAHGASIWMTRPEWLTGRLLSVDLDAGMTEHVGAFYRAAGCGAAYLDYVHRTSDAYARMVAPLPRGYRQLRDRDGLHIGGRTWHVIVGGGHSPAHACLYAPEDGILISGDQLLPRISPNVGVNASEPDADPLADFLASLNRLEGLPEGLLVLPSHDAPFHGLHGRCEELRAHHDERLERCLETCRTPVTAMDVARVLFDRPLDDHQTGFAIAETLAHLNHLLAAGRLTRATDGDGVWRYTATASDFFSESDVDGRDGARP
jgi:glyoxylase-like metal-dependent hydrolase (beta-lactamase superfamily II)